MKKRLFKFWAQIGPNFGPSDQKLAQISAVCKNSLNKYNIRFSPKVGIGQT